jgi:hypothetical protein
MFKGLKSVPVYVKVWRDRMEVMRLDTGRSATWRPTVPYSNERLVLAHFVEAEDHLKSLLSELFDHKKIKQNLRMVIQQMEGNEGGLSSVERRALVDMAEHSGALNVHLVEHERELVRHEASAIAADLEGGIDPLIARIIGASVIALILWGIFN